MKPKLCFFDHGLFVSFAIKLSKWFEVFYFVPWATQAFPSANNAFIGDGIPEIHRVLDFWRIKDDMDYFYFADIYDGGLQKELRKQGKKVFGSGRGDELEIYRFKLKSLMKDVGLPINNCKRIIGLPDLREYLKEHEDVYVKISAYRGTCETFHSISYPLVEPLLDEIENSIGGLKYILPFIVESSIDSIIETGYDGYTILGNYPTQSLYGIEVKDCGYLGCITSWKELPEGVRVVNEGLAALFKLTDYRMFFSTEIRIDKKEEKPYLIDITTRNPEPPSCLYQEMYENLEEIIIEGAQGKCVDPICSKQYGVCATIFTNMLEEHWTTIYFPDEIKQWVKLHNHCRIEGIDNLIPSTIKMGEAGMVLGVGDTLLEAIKHCRKNAEKIEGCGIHVKVEALVDGLENIRKAQDYGIKFGDQKLPTIEEILT